VVLCKSEAQLDGTLTTLYIMTRGGYKKYHFRKSAQIIVIVYQFLFFLGEERLVLTMMHLFGIGQGYKPYPTNDASACCEATYIYKTNIHFTNIGIFPFLLHFANLGFMTLSSFYELFLFYTHFPLKLSSHLQTQLLFFVLFLFRFQDN